MRRAKGSSTLTIRIGATLLIVLLMMVTVFGFIIYSSTSRLATQTRREMAHLYVSILVSNNVVKSQISTDAGKVVASTMAVATLRHLCSEFDVSAALYPSYASMPSENRGSIPSIEPNQASQSTSSAEPLYPQSQRICGGFVAPVGPNTNSAIINGSGGRPRALLVADTNIAYYTDQAEDTALVDSLWVLAITLILFGSIYLRVIFEVKSASFGLSPAELTGLLQEQEALLYGISEAVLGCDQLGRLRFFNKEAKDLLKLPDISLKRPLSVLVRGKRLKDLLTNVDDTEHDSVVVVGEHILVVNNIKVEREGIHLGSVATIRDITEWENLLREFDGMVGMTEALRAQAHEFSNKLHVIVGLIGLGYPQEAMELALDLTKDRATMTAFLEDAIDSKTVIALLLAKSAVASEKGISLTIDPSSRLKGVLKYELELLTILGNLIDNSIEELSCMGLYTELKFTNWISVKITSEEQRLHLIVNDSGRGVPVELQETIFIDGFSTKNSRNGARRGLGLALVKQIVEKHKGKLLITSTPGACFEIELPGVITPANSQEGLAEKVVEIGDHW